MQRQQSKKANKKQSQRAVSRKQSKTPRSTSGDVYLQPRGQPVRISSEPATYMSTTVDPTWLRMEGKVQHPELGGGVRIAGRQLLTSVTTTAGDNQLFAANGATLSSVNTIQISPDTLNGRLALQARNYDRYCFRKLEFTFVSRVPTTQAGSMALSWINDPTAIAPTFANVTSMSPCIQTSFHSPVARLIAINDMKTDKTFFTLYDASSLAAQRLTIQGTLMGVPDVTSIGAVNMGFLYVDYLVDLYQPTLDQGFSLRLTPSEQNEILRKRSMAPTAPPLEVAAEIGSLQLRIQQLKLGTN